MLSGSDDVSTGTDFPADDCRNGARTEITDEQVQYLIDEFDGNIYPKESAAFSVPPGPRRHGLPLAEILGLPRRLLPGDGDDIAVLVDNVRDDNFYDTDNQNGLSYVAGFYSSSFDDVLEPADDDDRRVRLAPPDRGEPAARADDRPVHERARRGRSCTRASSRTSTSTCCSTTSTPARRPG